MHLSGNPCNLTNPYVAITDSHVTAHNNHYCKYDYIILLWWIKTLHCDGWSYWLVCLAWGHWPTNICLIVTSINKVLSSYGRVIGFDKISFRYNSLGHINILIGTRQSQAVCPFVRKILSMLIIFSFIALKIIV
jgi:hypothetical protein